MAGEITHVEFPADDVEGAKRFYSAVAGWEFGEQPQFPNYHMFSNGPQSGGAVGKKGETAPHTLRVYVTVEKLEDAIAAATANGGTVCAEATEIPGMGRYAAVHDPEGNELGLWENPSGG